MWDLHGEGGLQEDLEQMRENCNELAAGLGVEKPPDTSPCLSQSQAA